MPRVPVDGRRGECGRVASCRCGFEKFVRKNEAVTLHAGNAGSGSMRVRTISRRVGRGDPDIGRNHRILSRLCAHSCEAAHRLITYR